MNALIFCNGYICDRVWEKNSNSINSSFIIGVDGGCNYLLDNGININLAIGDFDSIQNKDYLDRLPKIKKYDMNYSDLEIAINYCIESKKFCNVYLFGCTGKRSDHFIFNTRIMQKLFNNNIDSFMIDEFNVITLFNGKKIFDKENFEFFSLVPIYEDTVVSIKGSEYDLKDKKLDIDSALTLSNKWKDSKVEISTNKLIFIYLVF